MFGTIMPQDFQEYIEKRMVEAKRDVDLGVFDRLGGTDKLPATSKLEPTS
jgi:hypothetical protein